MRTVVIAGCGTEARTVADEVVRRGGRAVLLCKEPSGIADRPNGRMEVKASSLIAVRGAPGRMTAVTEDGDVECSSVIVADEPASVALMPWTTPLRSLPEGRGPRGTVVLDLRGGPDRRGRAHALEAAIEMLADGTKVVVLVDEVLAYGHDELLYRQAQQAGALFIRPLAVEREGQRMDVMDSISGAIISIFPDMVVSETAVNQPCTDRGSVSMGPLSTYRRGVLRLRANLLEDELRTEARAAAAIALRPPAEMPRPAMVDEGKCSACLTCVRICPFRAAYMNADGKARIDGDRCMACGKCAAACAGKAIALPGSTDTDLDARIVAAMEGE